MATVLRACFDLNGIHRGHSVTPGEKLLDAAVAEMRVIPAGLTTRR